MQQYSWNLAKSGVKHQQINQSTAIQFFLNMHVNVIGFGMALYMYKKKVPIIALALLALLEYKWMTFCQKIIWHNCQQKSQKRIFNVSVMFLLSHQISIAWTK